MLFCLVVILVLGYFFALVNMRKDCKNKIEGPVRKKICQCYDLGNVESDTVFHFMTSGSRVFFFQVQCPEIERYYRGYCSYNT